MSSFEQRVERYMDITRLSHSTVSEYGDCGEKLRLKKVERVEPAPSLALVGGSAVHEATANLDLLEITGTVEGPVNFSDAFEAELREREEDSQTDRTEFKISGKVSKAFPLKENLDWWYHHGPIFVDNWRRFLTGSPYQVAFTPEDEPAIEIEVNGTIGGAPVKGYVDRVLEDPLGNHYIVDLKTGIRYPKANQLRGYRLLLAQIYATWKINYGFYFMNRQGIMTGPEDLAAQEDGSLEYEYRNAWTGIQAGVFLPNTTSGWCSSCEVAKYCYAQNGEFAEQYKPYGSGNE